jgi:hypothetical protein
MVRTSTRIGNVCGIGSAALLAAGFLFPARPSIGDPGPRLWFFLAAVAVIGGLAVCGMWLGRGKPRTIARVAFVLTAVVTVAAVLAGR